MDPSLITEHANHLRVVFHPLSARRWIVNWDEVSSHLLGRAERELTQFTQDDTGAALLAELRGYAGPSPQRATARIGAADVLLPIHIKKDEVELRLFTTIMTLGTPQDVTLQELRLEIFFPGDEESERHYAHQRSGLNLGGINVSPVRPVWLRARLWIARTRAIVRSHWRGIR